MHVFNALSDLPAAHLFAASPQDRPHHLLQLQQPCAPSPGTAAPRGRGDAPPSRRAAAAPPASVRPVRPFFFEAMPCDDRGQIVAVQTALLTQDSHALAIFVAPGLQADCHQMLAPQHPRRRRLIENLLSLAQRLLQQRISLVLPKMAAGTPPTLPAARAAWSAWPRSASVLSVSTGLQFSGGFHFEQPSWEPCLS